MNEKVNLENRICRQAIMWERVHAENLQLGENDETKEADKGLAEAVQAYRRHLVEEALPVVDDEEAES